MGVAFRVQVTEGREEADSTVWTPCRERLPVYPVVYIIGPGVQITVWSWYSSGGDTEKSSIVTTLLLLPFRESRL